MCVCETPCPMVGSFGGHWVRVKVTKCYCSVKMLDPRNMYTKSVNHTLYKSKVTAKVCLKTDNRTDRWSDQII